MLNKFLFSIERKAAYLLGKGWGSGTVEKEFASAVSLLPNKEPRLCIDIGGCNVDTRTFFRDFWYFFQENGFELFRISPIGLIEIPKYRELDEFFITTNYLAKRK